MTEEDFTMRDAYAALTIANDTKRDAEERLLAMRVVLTYQKQLLKEADTKIDRLSEIAQAVADYPAIGNEQVTPQTRLLQLRDQARTILASK